MAVRVSKLWSNHKFSNLTNNSKLLYIYLATNPSISFTGVICPNLKVISIELNITVDELRECTRELVKNDYIHVGKYEGSVYFIVKEHFNSLPKSDSTVIKVTKEFKILPAKLVEELYRIGISVDKKMSSFKKPTISEVTEYSLSKGYMVDSKAFIDYYDDISIEKFNRKDVWFDSRGKQIKDWKSKLRKIWFKDSNKMTPCKDAPEGFENWFVMINAPANQGQDWEANIKLARERIYKKYVK